MCSKAWGIVNGTLCEHRSWRNMPSQLFKKLAQAKPKCLLHLFVHTLANFQPVFSFDPLFFRGHIKISVYLYLTSKKTPLFLEVDIVKYLTSKKRLLILEVRAQSRLRKLCPRACSSFLCLAPTNFSTYFFI